MMSMEPPSPSVSIALFNFLRINKNRSDDGQKEPPSLSAYVALFNLPYSDKKSSDDGQKEPPSPLVSISLFNLLRSDKNSCEDEQTAKLRTMIQLHAPPTSWNVCQGNLILLQLEAWHDTKR